MSRINKITFAQAQQLEKLLGQLASLHTEISTLAKKDPNHPVNTFKLTFVNVVLNECNILLEKNKPFAEFISFNIDDLPSNSDVTFMIAHYIESSERFRECYIYSSFDDEWNYRLKEEDQTLSTYPPKKLSK